MQVLRNLVSSKVYKHFSNIETYDQVLTVLKNVYVKPYDIISDRSSQGFKLSVRSSQEFNLSVKFSLHFLKLHITELHQKIHDLQWEKEKLETEPQADLDLDLYQLFSQHV